MTVKIKTKAGVAAWLRANEPLAGTLLLTALLVAVLAVVASPAPITPIDVPAVSASCTIGQAGCEFTGSGGPGADVVHAFCPLCTGSGGSGSYVAFTGHGGHSPATTLCPICRDTFTGIGGNTATFSSGGSGAVNVGALNV